MALGSTSRDNRQSDFRRILQMFLFPRNVTVVIIVVAILAPLTLYLYQQYDSLRIFMGRYYYAAQYVFDVPNPSNTTEIMKLGVNLSDRVITEHNQARVDVLLYPSNNGTHPQNYTLILNNSQCDTSEGYFERLRVECTVLLHKQPDGHYRANSTVTYGHAGSYYVSLADYDGSNPQKILNSRDDYIVIDSIQTANDLQAARLTLNVAFLSAVGAAIIGLMAFIVPHVWRKE